jgi:phospholipase/carboxylesterase
MKHDHFVVQQPESAAKQLLLFFHGVGDNPANMGQIGSYFAPLFPEAMIVSIGAWNPAVQRASVVLRAGCYRRKSPGAH